ncbi:MAG: DUF2569 family protein [Burkholderiales bacterium]|nr:DUF2569 family protein [Burkholderiales bacterium]
MKSVRTAYVVAGLSLPVAAFAAEPNVGLPSLLGPLQILVLLTAYLTRRRPIGGWLLLYYITSFIGLLLVVGFSIADARRLARTSFDGPVELGLTWVFTLLPSLSIVVVFLLGIWLLIRRTLANLRLLRQAMAVAVACLGVGLLLELFAWGMPGASGISLLQLVYGAIWVAYFRRSKRVQWVFAEGRWSPEMAGGQPRMSVHERKHRSWRAAVWACVGYAVGVLAVWVSGDFGQWSEMYFSVPGAVLALAAALVGYFSPITKERRAMLDRRALDPTQ